MEPPKLALTWKKNQESIMGRFLFHFCKHPYSGTVVLHLCQFSFRTWLASPQRRQTTSGSSPWFCWISADQKQRLAARDPLFNQYESSMTTGRLNGTRRNTADWPDTAPTIEHQMLGCQKHWLASGLPGSMPGLVMCRCCQLFCFPFASTFACVMHRALPDIGGRNRKIETNLRPT